MVRLYVEGGGDTAALQKACREGFTTFITKSGLKNRPRIVACGSRRDAYDSFCTAIAIGNDAMLLVDSEALVSGAHQQGEAANWLPWAHLRQRQGDGWEKPERSEDNDCHFMVQIMENWFLADRDTLKDFFGNGFKENKLPAATRAVEEVTKDEVYRALEYATNNCKTKATYGKGEHSFKLLAMINPSKVTRASPWARRFIDELKNKMGA